MASSKHWMVPVNFHRDQALLIDSAWEDCRDDPESTITSKSAYVRWVFAEGTNAILGERAMDANGEWIDKAGSDADQDREVQIVHAETEAKRLLNDARREAAKIRRSGGDGARAVTRWY